jgi:hypothetical protein
MILHPFSLTDTQYKKDFPPVPSEINTIKEVLGDLPVFSFQDGKWSPEGSGLIDDQNLRLITKEDPSIQVQGEGLFGIGECKDGQVWFLMAKEFMDYDNGISQQHIDNGVEKKYGISYSINTFQIQDGKAVKVQICAYSMFHLRNLLEIFKKPIEIKEPIPFDFNQEFAKALVETKPSKSALDRLLVKNGLFEQYIFIKLYTGKILYEMLNWFSDNLQDDSEVGAFSYINDPDYNPEDPFNETFLKKISEQYGGDDVTDDLKAEIYGNNLILLLRQHEKEKNQFLTELGIEDESEY